MPASEPYCTVLVILAEVPLARNRKRSKRTGRPLISPEDGTLVAITTMLPASIDAELREEAKKRIQSLSSYTRWLLTMRNVKVKEQREADQEEGQFTTATA